MKSGRKRQNIAWSPHPEESLWIFQCKILKWLKKKKKLLIFSSTVHHPGQAHQSLWLESFLLQYLVKLNCQSSFFLMASALYPFLRGFKKKKKNINFKGSVGGFKTLIFSLASSDEMQNARDKDIRANEDWRHKSRRKHFLLYWLDVLSLGSLSLGPEMASLLLRGGVDKPVTVPQNSVK